MSADLPATFVDTNIWLYAFIEAGEPAKSSRAREALTQIIPLISTQVIHEVCIASALESGATQPYSEDLQNNMTMEGRLTIINPL